MFEHVTKKRHRKEQAFNEEKKRHSKKVSLMLKNV